MVRELLDQADRTAREPASAVDERLRAVELLACGDFEGVSESLAALVDPRAPQAVQFAALRALVGFRASGVPALLLGPYRELTPAVRGEVVQVLLARAEWIGPLLSAVESQTVAPSDIPASRRSLLVQHTDEAIRRKATALLEADVPEERSRAVAAYREALFAPSDATRGHKVLVRECLVCHRLGQEGHDVGPNLLSVRHRSADELLVHILDPNREVPPNFVEYIVATTDGRTATGIVAAETATSITLRRAEGQQETILRADIETIVSSARSLMPEGLEKRITRAEMADLLALLLGRK